MVNCVNKDLIKKNTYDEQDVILQKALKAQGFYSYAVDGIHWTKTDEALRAMQKKRGLKIDGIAGKYTCTALGIWCKTEQPVTKFCSGKTTQIMQPNNYTCGVTCLRMAGSRHGKIPAYNDVMKITGCNPTNGTGHKGMIACLTQLMGYSSAVSVYRKDLPLDQLKKKITEGYDVFINLMTGDLSGWGGDWPHWVLEQCIDNASMWIDDPDRGANIRHDISTMLDCMDRNGNPDYILAKK